MSAAIARLIAHAAFWGLLLYGAAIGELRWRGVGAAILVFVVLKRDIRIT